MSIKEIENYHMEKEISSKRTQKVHSVVIQPSRGWSSLGLSDLWEYRDLVYLLIVREIRGIYRQTALGISWLFIRPLFNSLLLTLVFSGVVQVSTGGTPYPLFSLSAMIPWGYFSNSVTRASRSLVDNMSVISKIYFPRMTLPLAAAVSGLLDMGASMLVFFFALFFYQLPLRPEMIFLPFFMLISLLFALAGGLWLATLSVKFRDISFAVTFLLQALMYLSPVIYPVNMVPKGLQLIYQLNPMSGVIQGFRWALMGSESPPGVLFLISTGIVLLGLISGAYFFRRTERNIVDIL